MTLRPKSDSQKLGIIAGGGRLPVLLAEACRGTNRPFFVIAIEGFASEQDLSEFDCETVPLGHLGRSMELLRKHNCTAIVMAGHLSRPNFRTLKLDKRAIKLLPKFVSSARKGDNSLLAVLVQAFEEEGFFVCGADDVLTDLVMPVGILGSITPTDEDEQDIRRAVEVITALGSLDIGQGAVICHQLVLAVEAVEGTDAMLARCAQLPESLRGRPDRRRGVLAKMPKPGQERRVDLPTIGVATIENAAAAGLAGIAAAAGSVLVINRAGVIKAADDNGIFVKGFALDG